MSILPPGQRRRYDFPRFGMLAGAAYRSSAGPWSIAIKGAVAHPFTMSVKELNELPRRESTAYLHCVTTWSYGKVTWAGVRFADLYERILRPRAKPEQDAWVVFRGADRYRASLLLEDALSEDVLLADRMDGEPLPFEHGAPLRLVAPAHYGYKSIKHLRGIEFWGEFRPRRGVLAGMMEHPRGRVDFEERGRGVPGPVLRLVYRPLISPVVRRMRTSR